MTFISQIVYLVGVFIQYVGVIVVIVSSMIALVHLISSKHDMIKVRSEFAQNVMFGLEFIIAADILRMTFANDLDDIFQLGGIVLIRILLGYTLRKEMIGDKKFKLFGKK